MSVPEPVTSGAPPRQAAWLAVVVIAGIALYVILDVILQALPPHYNPISQAESDLGVGPYGWVMSINFAVRGLLLVWALGDFLLAVFPTDVPPHRSTLHGAVHLVVAALIFLAVALGELILGLAAGRDPRWASLRPALLAIAALTLLALVILTVGPGRAQYFGLLERVFIGLALLWMLVVGVRLTRAR